MICSSKYIIFSKSRHFAKEPPELHHNVKRWFFAVLDPEETAALQASFNSWESPGQAHCPEICLAEGWAK